MREERIPESPTERLFVSSTFRNLKAERDELAKWAFPRLRNLCEKRAVAWSEVDLRWGITDEQSAEGRVLPLCIEAIDRSTLFVGILGDDYYGWVPDAVPDEVLRDRPWLGDRPGSSITELEMVHALHSPHLEGRRFFYFRGAEPPDGDDGEPTLGRLGLLRRLIRSSEAAVHDDLSSCRALADQVLADVEACLKARYPPSDELAPVDRERLAHAAVAARHAQSYVETTRNLGRIESHFRGGDRVLFVTGPSGVGKSALLAHWLEGRRRRHPEEHVILHFVGASPESASWDRMLRRFLDELNRLLETRIEIPDDPEALRTAFARALSMAATGSRILLVIDGLDQLVDREGALELSWLPLALPPHVRLVVSTLPGPPLDEAWRRGWPHLEVEPLEPGQRQELIDRYLADHAKSLAAPLRARLVGHPATGSPLFLRTLLEELKVHGDHGSLAGHLERELEATSTEELLDRVLERYEADYERDRPGLVADSTSLLWAARHGLSEPELLDLLGDDEKPLPSLHWLPLAFAAGASLVERDGLIGFAHQALAAAVERRYLEQPASRRSAREKLISYFETRDVSPRQIDELPWQLAELGDTRRLAALLKSPGFFRPANQRDRFEMRRYWARIAAEDSGAVSAAYRPIVEAPERFEDLVDDVEILLQTAGDHAGAARLLSFQLRKAVEKDDKKEMARCLNVAGTFCKYEGDLDGAVTRYERSLSLYEELDDPEGIAANLGQLSMARARMADYRTALELARRQEALARRSERPILLASALANQAIALTAQRDWKGALRLREAQAEIARRIGDPELLANALANLGELTPHAVVDERDPLQVPPAELAGAARAAAGLLSEARDLAERNLCVGLLRQIELYRERFTKMFSELPAHWTGHGVEAFRRGDLDRALELFEASEEIARALEDRNALGISLGEKALVLLRQGRLEPALELLREEEGICRELEDDTGLQMCLGNQVAVLLAQDDLEAAADVLEEQERLCRRLGDTAGLGRALGHRAEIALKRGDLSTALSATRRCRELAEEAGDEESLATALLREAFLLACSDSPRRARAAAKRARRISRRRGWTALAREADGLLRTLPRGGLFRSSS